MKEEIQIYESLNTWGKFTKGYTYQAIRSGGHFKVIDQWGQIICTLPGSVFNNCFKATGVEHNDPYQIDDLDRENVFDKLQKSLLIGKYLTT